jgi:hypothetical protein
LDAILRPMLGRLDLVLIGSVALLVAAGAGGFGYGWWAAGRQAPPLVIHVVLDRP